MWIEALSAGRVESVPFQWAYFEQLLPKSRASQLAATFPTARFHEAVSTREDKQYRMFVRELSTAESRDLPRPWAEFVAELRSPTYADAVSSVIGRPLGAAILELRLWRYTPGCRLGPHVDKPEKLVTQMFYFQPLEDSVAGGDLRILGSPSEDHVHAALRPANGASAILVRSPASWHSVAEVTGPGERSSLQAVFRRNDRLT